MNKTEIVACTSSIAGHRVSNIQSSDKGFTIASIERKSNLLRTYNQQTKHQDQPSGIIPTSFESNHTQTK